MRPNPLYAQCVRRTSALLGGYAALGERLGVPASLVERWAAGRSAVPQQAFLRMVDILDEGTRRQSPP